MSETSSRASLDSFLEEVRIVTKQGSLLSRDPPTVPSASSGEALLEALRICREELLVAEEQRVAQVEESARIQRLLDAERQRYADLFRYATDGYIVTDAHGVLREVNLAAAHLLGCEARFLVGKPLIALCSTTEIAAIHAALGKAVAGAYVDQDLTFHRPDGSPFLASIRATCLHDQGALLWTLAEPSIPSPPSRRSGIYSAFVPVDGESAQHDEELAIDPSFLAVLAHDLRSPLSAVLGWTQLLQRHAISAEEVPRALAVIERSVRSQLGLIEDVLDLARLTTRKLEMNCEPLELGACIERVVESLAPAIQKKRLELTMRRGDADVPIAADRKRIEQIVGNLITNAVKFTPSGGRIAVSVGAESQLAVVHVEDSGLGIDPGMLPHVFERHVQDETVRGTGGLGLGLFIVKKLVELHGGTVLVTSEGLGHGSTFTVQIPLRPGSVPVAEEPVRARPPPDSDLKGCYVLAVDDDEATRQVMEVILKAQGARVAVAGDLESAEQIISADLPDVIISDIGLPGADGFELARRFRAKCPHVPCVALSGYAGTADRERARAAGFVMFLAKPISVSVLVEAVLLARSRPAPV